MNSFHSSGLARWRTLGVRSLTAALLAVTLAACRDGGTDGCYDPFEKTLTADLIKGHNEVYLKVEHLDFLADPNLVLEDVELNLTIKGRHNRTRQLTLDLNGIKVARKDGRALVEGIDDLSVGDSRARFKLHKMFLNGALPFSMMMTRLRLQKGVLKINLHGHQTRILSASVTFKGKIKKTNCQPPPPPPPPPPEPLVTRLDSVTPNESPTQSTTITFTFSSNTAGATFWCALDSQPPAPCSSPQSYSGLMNGNHDFAVYATAPDRNAPSPTVRHLWTVNAPASPVTITNIAELPSLTNQTSIRFEFQAASAVSYECDLDGIATACSSPKVYSSLGEGAHTFSVKSKTAAGAVSAPATFVWNVDLTPPVTSILDVQPAAAVSNQTSRTFTFAANESSSYECSVDNGTFTACESPLVVAAASEGSHWFEVRATDAAGNQGPSASFAWTTDLTPPVIQVTAASPAPGLTASTHLSVDFTVSETGTVQCSLDGALPTTCASPYMAGPLAEGAHSLTISATDGAGNSAEPVILTWMLDFTPPLIGFGNITPAGRTINSRTLQAEVNASENSTLRVWLDSVLTPLTESPLTFTDLAEGAHTITVVARDTLGNESSPITYTFRVDLTAPVLELLVEDPASPISSDRQTFTWNTSEDARFECELDMAGFAPCQGSFEAAGLGDGTHVFKLRATDAAGNLSETVMYSWVVDTRPPVTAISVAQNGNAIDFTLSADETGVSYRCSLDGGSEGPCGPTKSYSGLSVGNHIFRAWAIDAAGNRDPVGAVHTFSVTMPISTSILSASPSATLVALNTMSLQFSADQGGATFMCSLDGGAATTCSSPMNYAGLADGSHLFVVRAVDAYGIMDPLGALRSWTVDTIAPVVTSLSTAVTTNTITVSWTTNEPSTSQLLYGLGFSVSQSTGEDMNYTTSHSLRIVGLSANTNYSVQVRGRDAAGNVGTGTLRTVKTNR